jgi:hypothetical protein
LIPIFTKQVQLDILVQKDINTEVPLAEFLDFGTGEDGILEKGDVYLHVFIQQSSMCHKEQISEKIGEIMQDFNS